jgi:Zn-dependent M28 family amino/carboxypeptidase
MQKQLLSVLGFLLFSVFAVSQQVDSAFIRSIYTQALVGGKAYSDLRELCKDIGPRLSGSAQAQMAVEWGERKMKFYGFDRVYLQEIKVPHWERGTTESAWFSSKTHTQKPVKILALGGSVGTNGLMRGSIVVFNSLDALRKATRSDVEGKIVLLNQPMDDAMINTFKAYGACYSIRGEGAIEAAKLGAKAILVRSLNLAEDDHPHTGSMHYDEKIEKIPAAAIATLHADLIASQAKIETVNFTFEMDCRSFPDATSYNVIGELIGTVSPEKIIVVGGHLDSWDTGEGAHDDGAGIVHSLEAIRILKTLNYKPKHTLRVVFFMNEENGNFGGKSYANWMKEKGEMHIAALESDRGGFAPRGFSCDGTNAQVALMQKIVEPLRNYELHDFEKGYGGVDIGPLKSVFEGIPLFGFVPDSQRYFDYHHAETDVFESVHKRELELGCAAVASFLVLLDCNL